MRIICFGIKVSLFLSYFLTGARMHVGFDFGHVLNDAECIHTLSTHLLIYIFKMEKLTKAMLYGFVIC